ncbi:hypothetical protein [Legionella tucsonensis]|uniref:Gala protein type 1, 3 or 4 n=1 Tax=Legionella tucsonensis TaxID=40335 RepID=A0A0W0ZYH9_9GAMM|nr:hypothetical protein [Legionella tucsonensis]KTD74155.1 Gala protein type 1, 3 or 4 [Legionella tucsonensis]
MLPKFNESILLEKYDPINKSLNLSNQGISDEHIEKISKFIEEHNIEKVNLDNNYIKSLQGFKNNRSLKELSLSFNYLHASGVEEFCKENDTLESLNVSNNTLDDEGAEYVALHKSLKFLNISSNRLSNKGVKSIAETQNQNLQSLKIGGNYFDADGVVMLADNKYFKALDLSESCIGYVAPNLLQIATTPFKLAPLDGNLHHSDIDEEDAENIEQPTLIETESLKGIKALAKSQNLTLLKIKYGRVSSEGIKCLISAVNENSIRVLKCSNCHDPKAENYEEMEQLLLQLSECYSKKPMSRGNIVFFKSNTEDDTLLTEKSSCQP